ncbi:MAG: type VI secretion system tube protein TssD [bacterium]
MPMFGELLVQNHEGTQLEGPRGDSKCSMICEFSQRVFRPYDVETAKLEGVRRLTPFVVIKEIDKLTPQLYEIACKGRNCKEVLIKLYRTAQDTGDEEEYFNYVLTDAKIIAIENYMPSTKYADSENIGHLEKIEFLPKSFTWKYLEGGVEYQEIMI